jgi:hypothetical protein
MPQCFLKTLAERADGCSVADANIFPDEDGFTPRPAWQVIEAARRQYLTGELTLSTSPATRIYLRDGFVYFAERTSDGALPIRLMMEGVITREQMQRGTVIVNGVEHVGRMFDADPTIDRASVELCTELFTDDVMVSVANARVERYELALYRRHPSGIDRWYPHTVPVAARQGNSQATGAQPARSTEAASAAPRAAVRPKPKPEVQPEFQREAKTEVKPEMKTDVSSEVTPEAKPAAQQEATVSARSETPAPVRAEPKNNLNAPPITQAVPVISSARASVPPPPPITQTIPVTQAPATAPTVHMPATMPAPTAQIPVTQPPAASNNEVDATAIADEVAEAIKRAFAGMGAGY